MGNFGQIRRTEAGANKIPARHTDVALAYYYYHRRRRYHYYVTAAVAERAATQK